MTTGEARIWTYANEREGFFAIPDKRQLAELWQEHHGVDGVLILDEELYGICEEPTQSPTAVISLDLCEVVRETALSFAKISGHELTNIGTIGTEGGPQYTTTLGWHDLANGQDLVTTTAQEFMHNDQVLPVQFQEAIALFMRRWRAQGVYIVANTSTLPGCEASTIRFLAEKYAGTAQGILFPRNHDGRGSATKASILESALDKIGAKTGYDLSTLPIINLEDTPHHAHTFAEYFDDVKIFMPAYSWNEVAENSTHITRVAQTLGTIDTFIATDNYLLERGIIS